jgi:hypothetical protein
VFATALLGIVTRPEVPFMVTFPEVGDMEYEPPVVPVCVTEAVVLEDAGVQIELGVYEMVALLSAFTVMVPTLLSV